MRTQRRDSVHVLAVTRAGVLKVALDGRYQVQGKGKNFFSILIQVYLRVIIESWPGNSDCTCDGSRSKLTVSGMSCHENVIKRYKLPYTSCKLENKTGTT